MCGSGDNGGRRPLRRRRKRESPRRKEDRLRPARPAHGRPGRCPGPAEGTGMPISNTALRKPKQQFPARPVVCEAVSRTLCLAEDVASHPHFRPEVVDTECDDGEKHVDDVDAQQGATRAMEREPVHRVRAGSEPRTARGRSLLRWWRRRAGRTAKRRLAGRAGRPRQLQQAALRTLHTHRHPPSLQPEACALLLPNPR